MCNNSNHTLDILLGAITPAEVTGPRPSRQLTGLTNDSRAVTDGSIFVAVRGFHIDGHCFIDKAVAAGAAVIVAETIPENPSPEVTWVKVPDSAIALGKLASQWYDNPSQKVTLVGVTGTNGKTTIATLLYDLARLNGQKAGLLSTVVNKINDKAVESTHTTPDPLELNALLAQMVEEGCTFVAMEVSSHAAAQHRIAGLDFDGAIFTNLTRDHLDYHGTFANYLKAKQSFFDNLKPEAFALTNTDDPNGTIIIQNTKARRHTYSIRGNADFRGNLIENRIDGMLINFNGTEVETMFVGHFNAANLTAVFGAASLLGYDTVTALRSISTLRPVAGRFQPYRSSDGVTAIVDYAHTPDALVNVLDTIIEISGNTGAGIITVVGAGGDRDRGKRPIMAAEAQRRSKLVILTADNPRSENPADIISEMMTGVDPELPGKVTGIIDRGEAIRSAIALARPGDIVLVAGKGHETYQVLHDKTIHFDDREEVIKAFGLRKTIQS